MIDVQVKPPFIKLSQFLKFANVISSGGEAKNYIVDGLVTVNGDICTEKGKKLYDGYIVGFESEQYKVVIVE
ncbi:MAG: RNA-binding S4 domain-containing protein [Oscillospiraceae bacterium]